MHFIDITMRKQMDELQNDQIPLLVEVLLEQESRDIFMGIEDCSSHPPTPPSHGSLQRQESFSSSFSCSRTKIVSFSKVYVREHCVIIGDNLSCNVLPLSLGWGHTEEQTFDVNTYETQQRKKKSLSSKPLTFMERLDVLKRVSGMKHSDIMTLERERLHHATRRCAMST
jgi:hypothetical protein